MNRYAADLWDRAGKSLVVARAVLALDPDAVASRAYYAAFYAVSAHFALDDISFIKHSAVEAAVHRDLVKPGIWPKTLGRGYSTLYELRTTGDYGGSKRVSPGEAERAVEIAAAIIEAIAGIRADEFADLGENSEPKSDA